MWWILYGYYVMFMCGGQNSWFCKASLRICFISLFECKDPWMIKADSLIFKGFGWFWVQENWHQKIKDQKLYWINCGSYRTCRTSVNIVKQHKTAFIHTVTLATAKYK